MCEDASPERPCRRHADLPRDGGTTCGWDNPTAESCFEQIPHAMALYVRWLRRWVTGEVSRYLHSSQGFRDANQHHPWHSRIGPELPAFFLKFLLRPLSNGGGRERVGTERELFDWNLYSASSRRNSCTPACIRAPLPRRRRAVARTSSHEPRPADRSVPSSPAVVLEPRRWMGTQIVHGSR